MSCRTQNLDKHSKYNCPGSLNKYVLSADARLQATLKTTQLHALSKPAKLGVARVLMGSFNKHCAEHSQTVCRQSTDS